MWFLFSMATVLMWGFADLFYKRGNTSDDKFSPLKTVACVGVVMGVHATLYLLIKGVDFRLYDIVKYLPVSLLYIISMAIGYWGLKYLDLSVSSPIQNASGAIVTLLCLLFFDVTLSALDIIGIVVISVGLILVGFFEQRDEDYVTLVSKDKKHSVSLLAIIFPLGYCLLDALGTFADAVYLDELELISEDAALVAYEYTFLIAAVICIIILAAKKQKLSLKNDKFLGIAAAFETAGQFFYVYAMSGNAVVAAPLIAAYCAFSVLFSRIFLKEKLKLRKYFAVFTVILGVILLGVSEGLAG